MTSKCALSVLALVTVFLPCVVFAGEPTDQVRQSVDEVLKRAQTQGTSDGRRTEIRQIAGRLFDFEETAKRALGPHWQQRTPEERQEFVRLFTDLLESAYVTQIEKYDGEKIAYTGESVDGDQAIVKTRIVTKQGSEVPVDYRLIREKNTGWRVYDVIVEGVSLVGNYRAQFNKVIQTSSYQDLVKRMRAKDFAGPPAAPRRRG